MDRNETIKRAYHIIDQIPPLMRMRYSMAQFVVKSNGVHCHAYRKGKAVKLEIVVEEDGSYTVKRWSITRHKGKLNVKVAHEVKGVYAETLPAAIDEVMG